MVERENRRSGFPAGAGWVKNPVLQTSTWECDELRQRDRLQARLAVSPHQQHGVSFADLVELLDPLQLLQRVVIQAGRATNPLGDPFLLVDRVGRDLHYAAIAVGQ